MKMTTPNALVAISVTPEFLEYRIGDETKHTVNSAEFFSQIIDTAREGEDVPTFLVEAVGGWESGIVHALQVARLEVCVVESETIQRHLGLATADEVDAAAVRRYGETMRDSLTSAHRVERVVSAYAARVRKSGNWWQRLLRLVHA